MTLIFIVIFGLCCKFVPLPNVLCRWWTSGNSLLYCALAAFSDYL